MSTEPIYHCDGPDCTTHQTSTDLAPIRGWIRIAANEGGGTAVMDFCGWDCVLRKAATVPPTVVIPLGDQPDPDGAP